MEMLEENKLARIREILLGDAAEELSAKVDKAMDALAVLPSAQEQAKLLADVGHLRKEVSELHLEIAALRKEVEAQQQANQNLASRLSSRLSQLIPRRTA